MSSFFPELGGSSSSSSSSSSYSYSESEYLWLDDLPSLESPPCSPALSKTVQEGQSYSSASIIQPPKKQDTTNHQQAPLPSIKKRLSTLQPPQPPKRYKPPFEATPLNIGIRNRTMPRKPPTPQQKKPVAEFPVLRNDQGQQASSSTPKTSADPPRNFIINPSLWRTIRNINIPWLRILSAKKGYRMPLDDGNILRFNKVHGGLIKVRLQHKGFQHS